MANEINKPTQPALPLPEEQYNRRFSDQLHNVLRLFFGQITTAIGAVLSSDQGGKFIYQPHGSFYSSTTLNLTPNTDTAVSFAQDRFASAGITAENSNQRITVSADGVYKITVEGLTTVGSGTGSFYVWLQKNGTDIDYSTRYYQMDAINGQQYVTFNLQVMESMVAGDYITVIVNGTGNSPKVAAFTTKSGIVGAQIEVSFVSNA